MNPEERELLDRTLKLSLENNEILRKMQRAARWSTLWGFIKILIIIVPLVVGYLFLQPYLEPARENYNTIKELLDTSSGASNSDFFQSFLRQ